ncbi:Dbl homology domain-containing protein, partial [Neoconidiobolus thromboides FSU 785]
VFIEGLKSSQCYPSDQVDIIAHKLFFNYLDIKKIHEPLCLGLSSRQKNMPVIKSIGDILVLWAEQLDPYNIYGARIQFATDFVAKEKNNNIKFQQYLNECSQKKELKRLTIDSFISLPTRRLARYPLLFKEIMKRTPEDNPDYKLIPQ